MLRICANSPTMRVVDGVDPYKIKAQSTANKRNKKFSHHPVSAGTGVTPALHFQRACRLACTNLLGFLVRYVRTRGSMRLRRAAKPPIFALPLAARTRHAWLVRLTRARGKSSQRERNALFDDFWYFWSCKSTVKEKLLYDSSRAKTSIKIA